MRIILNMCLVLALAAAMASPTLAAADDYQLQTIAVVANAALEVRMPAGDDINNPMYLDAKGQWKVLKTSKAGTAVSFSLPQDTLGSTVIILRKPKWLALPDADAPVVETISIDGTAYATGTEVALGRFKDTPRNIMITVADRTNPLACSRLAVSVNGRPAAELGCMVKTDQSKDGKHADIIIAPGDLPLDTYRVLVTLADASPEANATALTLLFSTAPLLKNGEFEQADKNGGPLEWVVGAWDQKPETKFEAKIVDGGHSGKALMIQGISPPLNLVAGQQVELEEGKTYVLSGYYKNEGNLGHASLIASGGKDKQYDSMPPLQHAEEWTPFSWEIVPKAGAPTYTLYLRSGGQGKVYFDDVKLELKE